MLPITIDPRCPLHRCLSSLEFVMINPPHACVRRRLAHLLSAALLAATTSTWAAPPKPAAAPKPPPALAIEVVSTHKLAPADGHRIFLVDPALGHLVDGRTHIIDGRTMRFLSLLGTGFAGYTTLSRDGRHIYVSTTYHNRLQRGTRSDVVEVYRSEDLVFDHEIELPAKRVQGLQIRALTAMSADDRFLLLQNATPATSITVVDTKNRRVAAEFDNPGCWGVLPWPANPLRLSSICGDGRIATYDLNEDGSLKTTQASVPFFDPDVDPVFMHYELVGNELTFVSYGGQVHGVSLSDAGPQPLPRWSLLDKPARKLGWRPGGFQLFAIDQRSGLLYVAMHDKGGEGSHKTPAKQIWVYDLKSQRRVAVMPGSMALSMTIAQGEQPRLYLLNAADNRLFSFDLTRARAPTKPLLTSAPMGETPVYLVLQ